MAGPGPDARAAARLGAWLRNAVLAAVVALLAMSCWFVFRLGVLTYRVEQALVAVSADVKQVTATVADLSRDVAVIRQDIREAKDKARQAVPYDEARQALEEAFEMGRALKADDSALPQHAEVEIKALLGSILTSGCVAEVRGKKQSALTLWGRLYTKYRLRRRTLTSAEAFIDEVAAETMFGNPYYLVDEGGNRTLLGDWLTERLKAIRAAGDAAEPAPQLPPP